MTLATASLPSSPVSITPNKRREIWKEIGYSPSEEQANAHDAPARFKIVVGGERGGKSRSATAEACARYFADLIHYKEPILYWLVGPDYEQARAEFIYCVEWAIKLGIVMPGGISQPQQGPCRLKLLGGEIVTKSANDPERLGSVAPHGIIMCEAAQHSYESFLRLRGRLAEKRGWLWACGCMVADTLVFTDQGLQRIGDIVGGQSHLIEYGVSGLDGLATATLAFHNGLADTVKVRLSRGIELEGTLNHRVIARLPDGSVTWVSLDDLTYDTLVALRVGMDLWGEDVVPEAYWLGLYIAEGCCSKEDRITITNADEEITTELAKLGFRQHGYHWRKTDHFLVARMKELGVDVGWKAPTKEVPRGILSADRSSVIQFLRGLFDGDGTATHKGVAYYTSSQTMAKQVQMLLLNLGVVSSVNKRMCKLNSQVYPSYTVAVSDPHSFAEIVGFGLERKQSRALATKDPKFHRNQANAGGTFLGNQIVWCRVLEKEYGQAETFDLHVPDGHAYVGNGAILHNTFEGSLGWYPEKWIEWQRDNLDAGQSFSIPTWSNLAVFPGGRDDPEILALERSYPPDRFMERFGAVPTPPTGRVLKEVKESLHVFDWQFDDNQPVYLWIDPGYHPSAYAIEAFQIERATDIIRGLDEIYVQGLTTSEVIVMCQQRPWWGQVGGGAIDVAAKQHQAMAAPIEIWDKEGGLRLEAARVDPEDGLDRLRTFLRPDPFTGWPKITFSPKQVGFLAEAGLAKNPYPEIGIWRYKTDSHGNVTSDKPEDKNNHAAKAVIYGLVAKFGYTKKLARKTLNPYTGVTNARTR